MTGQTPFVDRALSDPLGVPPGVAPWLRRIEENARELHERLADAISGEVRPVDAVEEAYDELRRFLFDYSGSALHRLLRRPISQLQLESPAARSFGRYSTSLFERASEAANVQLAAAKLGQDIDDLRRKFQGWFPRSLAQHLRGARLQPSDLGGARRLTDIRAMESRLKRVESILAQLADQVSDIGAPTSVVDVDGDAPTVQELQALTRIQLRRRNYPTSATSSIRRLQRIRWLNASQVNAIGTASGWRPSASKPAHFTAQLLAERALNGMTGDEEAASDAPVWCGLLAAASVARAGTQNGRWFPKLDLPVAHGRAVESVTTFFAVPVDQEYVLVTQQHKSPVAVMSRRIAVGEDVECGLRDLGAEDCDTDAAAADINPLFHGFRRDRPARYTTKRRAVLKIVAQCGDGWYARITQPGQVQLASTNRGGGQSNSRAISVLQARRSGAPQASELDLELSADAEWSFGGIRTRLVRAPIAGTGALWLRTASVSRDSGSRMLDAEHEFWRQISCSDPTMVPQAMGRGSSSPTDAGFLYSPPHAMSVGGSRPLSGWTATHPATFMRALARTFTALRDHRYCLGLYHLDAFFFGVSLGRRLEIKPKPVIVYGGAATRYGQPFRSLAKPEQVVYERIRFRGVPPPQAQGEVASAEADVTGLGLLFLELLAVRDLGAANQWYSWNELLDVVSTAPECFVRPTFAQQLAEALSAGVGATRMMTLIDALAAQ